MADGANRPAYNSTWQIRNDAWCSLEETSGRLLLAGPGMPAFQKMRRLFTAGKYDRFAALVRGINRALTTDS